MRKGYFNLHWTAYLYRFTPSHIVKKVEDKGYELLVVIDLTNTFRYYNGAQVGVQFISLFYLCKWPNKHN